MADRDTLTDIERAWLMSIDALMVQMTPNAHAAAATKLIELWGHGRPAFRKQLAERAGAWRHRQRQLEMLAGDDTGPCRRLVDLIEGGDRGKPQQHPCAPSRKPRRIVYPSTRQFGPVRQMSDEEVAKFLGLLDAEGISVIFDPGVSFNAKGELYKPSLIRLDNHPIYYEQISPAYERGEIGRAWDPGEREPAIALAVDLALLATAKEKKWTWVVCDRHFSRLPWGHPCKLTPEGRPGWKLVTGLLEGAGLVEWRKGQTWRLVHHARPICTHIMTAWKLIAKN